jgi:hypothetical protein
MQKSERNRKPTANRDGTSTGVIVDRSDRAVTTKQKSELRTDGILNDLLDFASSR